MRKLSLCKRNIILCGSMAVVLCGCAAVTKDELQTMIEESETISLEIAEPLDVDRLGTKENESKTGEETSSEGLLEEETESVRDKSVEEWMEDIEAMGRYTVEELESIAEDARVYEAYGSSPEQAVNMALADAVNGKTNGSVDMTFTLPVVVDENGVPYPTDPSNGQPIIPETEEPAKESESVNSTMENVAQESENVNKKDLPVTIESDDDGYGNKVVVRGKWEVVEVTTPDGVTHTLHSEDEYMQFLVQWDFEHDEEQQQYIASEDRFKDIGTYSGYYGSKEEFLEAEKNSTVHGKVQ